MISSGTDETLRAEYLIQPRRDKSRAEVASLALKVIGALAGWTTFLDDDDVQVPIETPGFAQQRPGYTERDALWWQVGATQQVAPAAQFFQPLVDPARGRRDEHRHVRRLRARDRVGDRPARQPHGGPDRLPPARARRASSTPTATSSEVRYDPLGVVVTATSYGTVGTQPWGFDALSAVTALTPATLSDALASPGQYLQGAASYTWYDLGAWAADGVPTTVLSLDRGAAPPRRRGRRGGGRAHPGGRRLPRRARPHAPETRRWSRTGPPSSGTRRGTSWSTAAGTRSSRHASPAVARLRPRRLRHQGAPRAAVRAVLLAQPRPTRATRCSSTSACPRSRTTTRWAARSGKTSRTGPSRRTTFGAWTVEQADPNDNVVGSVYGALRLALPDRRPRAAGVPARPCPTPVRRRSRTSTRWAAQAGTLAQGGSTAARPAHGDAARHRRSRPPDHRSRAASSRSRTSATCRAGAVTSGASTPARPGACPTPSIAWPRPGTGAGSRSIAATTSAIGRLHRRAAAATAPRRSTTASSSGPTGSPSAPGRRGPAEPARPRAHDGRQRRPGRRRPLRPPRPRDVVDADASALRRSGQPDPRARLAHRRSRSRPRPTRPPPSTTRSAGRRPTRSRTATVRAFDVPAKRAAVAGAA